MLPVQWYPSRHAVGVAVVELQSCPSGQSVHAIDPVAAEYDSPRTHASHTPSTLPYPGPHSMVAQRVPSQTKPTSQPDTAVALHVEWAGHAVIAVALHVPPAGQAMHSVAPSSGWNDPAAHDAHAARAVVAL